MKTANERFDEKVEVSPSGCFVWQSATSYNGYGIFWVGGGRSAYAHRWALERSSGSKIANGMHVMHLCNNKQCVNPKHLEVGTCADNIRMAARDGLMPRGERNGGGGKLVEADVREILAMRDIGATRMARRFGVSPQTVKMIRRRTIWKHVEAPV